MNILTQNNTKKYISRNNQSRTRPYSIWHSMIKRCYGKNAEINHPTYIDCSVVSDWLDFQNFAEWVKTNDSYDDNYDLDKDILIPNNKIYSPDRCVFVPREINCVFRASYKRGRDLPVGVHYQKRNKYKKYGASVHKKHPNSKVHLGYFECPNEAHAVYVVAKEAYVKEVANKWRGQIDERVYDALMNWTVNP